MQDGDGELKALLLPERQAFGPAVGNAEEIEPLQHLLNARLLRGRRGSWNRWAWSSRFCRTVSSP